MAGSQSRRPDHRTPPLHARRLRAGRLLAALTGLGVAAHEAASLVSTADREAILAHVDRVQANLDVVRRLAPAASVGAVVVRQLGWEPVLALRLEREVTALDDALAELGRWQASVAAERGCGVRELPQASRGDGLPTGPAVVWHTPRKGPQRLRSLWSCSGTSPRAPPRPGGTR